MRMKVGHAWALVDKETGVIESNFIGLLEIYRTRKQARFHKAEDNKVVKIQVVKFGITIP
ncbi:MAG: hypothetical protein KAR06_11095 [Deltaproteobacteria bacterium]|nr:hypothetical protein [Deltaproteobacteria bacterium]